MIDISIITVGMNHLLYLKVLLRSLYKENIPQASMWIIVHQMVLLNISDKIILK